MNRGYAFGFLLVLLIVILGLYVAFTGFMASREAQRAQAGPEPATAVAQAPATEVLASPYPSPSPYPTVLTLPTPVPGLTATLTVMAAPTGATTAEATEPAEPSAPTATEPPAPLPTEPPTAQVEPPTPVPAPGYSFRLAGPPVADPDYPLRCYILGTVRDAAGNGLEGIGVQAATTWTTLPIAISKGGVDLGKYDIPINCERFAWNLFLVDAAGKQISSQVQIQFDPDAANAYRVDWVRSY